MAVRIAGVVLPDEKSVHIALMRIYGVGRSLSHRILHAVKIEPFVKVRDLPERKAAEIRDLIEKEYRVEGELRREVMGNIRRLKEIGSYRGLRHARRLPVRGQRTRTNSRTVRGNVRRTAGSGKRRTPEKT